MMAISKGFWCAALISIVSAGSLAADQQRITLTSSAAELVLGKDKTARLSIQVNCSPGGTPTVRASVGSLGAVKSTDSGAYQVEYTPPWKREPDVALIWASIPEQGCSPGFATIALLAEEKIKARVSPNARVSLKIGKSKFGPARADPHGLVEIPAKLSPGYSYGRLEIALPGGKTRHRKIALGVKPRARVGAISVPKIVRANGRSTTRVFLFGSSASGRILRKASFGLKTRAGRIKRITSLGGGLYSAVFRPFPSLTGGRVKITASLSRPGTAKRSFTVRLLPGQRIAIGIESSLPTLIADGESKAIITATIADSQDKGLEQLPVEITSSRGRMGAVSDLGGGRYQAELVAPLGGSGSTKIVVSVGSQAGFLVLPLAKPELLAVTADPPSLVADGKSQASIRIRAFGPQGASGATEVLLEASGGKIPARAPLQGSRAEATFQAGTRTGTARVEVRLGPARTHIEIPLVPGKPAELQLSSARAEVVTTCNAVLPLQARVVDAHGNLVPEAQLELDATAGKLDPPVPGESGELTIGYRPPLDSSGYATVRARVGGNLDDELTVRLVEPPERFGLALSAGVEQNLDRFGAPSISVEGSFRMFASMFLLVGLEYFAHRFDDLEIDAIPAWLGLAYRFENESSWTPTLEAGVQAVGFRAAVRPSGQEEVKESTILPAVFLQAGLDVQAGPGGAFIELGYRYVPWWSGDVFTGRLGGISVRLGYRLAF